MNLRTISFFSFLILILFLVDLYAYKGIRMLIPSRFTLIFKYLYWFISLLIYTGICFVALSNPADQMKHSGYLFFYSLVGLMILSVVPKLFFIVFHLLEDLGFVATRTIKSIQGDGDPSSKISRSTFLSQIGLMIAAIPFFGIIYGMVWGKYDYKVVKNTLKFKGLPKPFHGLKIVQFSDAHLGSFMGDTDKVAGAFKMINELKPDLIFFTGDLVNHYASELKGWDALFSSLEAPLGKFSILGNHDYSDYMPWDSLTAKKQNLEELKAFHAKTGFKLLLNENVELSKGTESIRIIGVENWGKGGFTKYGNIEKAMQGSHTNEFKLLLSHDPSHWDEKILGKTNINLTFSGHTHGMQFGINLGTLKYSPVQHKYPRWMGLYQEQEQFLYVNPGFGFLAFPGRVGISPELSFFELYSI